MSNNNCVEEEYKSLYSWVTWSMASTFWSMLLCSIKGIVGLPLSSFYPHLCILSILCLAFKLLLSEDFLCTMFQTLRANLTAEGKIVVKLAPIKISDQCFRKFPTYIYFYSVLYIYQFSRKIPTYTFIQSYTFIICYGIFPPKLLFRTVVGTLE